RAGGHLPVAGDEFLAHAYSSVGLRLALARRHATAKRKLRIAERFGNPPIDLGLTPGPKCRVDLRERLATEEAVVRRKRRRMGGFEDDVPADIDAFFLRLR